MNYARIYSDIIEKYGYNKKPMGVYSENHHIIPRCMSGTDDKQNLIYLDARCHLLVHWLLVRMYPNNYELTHAFSMMCLMQNNYMERIIPNLKILAEARRRKSLAQSKKLKGNNIEFNTVESNIKRVETAIRNGSYRGLKNGKSQSVDIYNYFTGELIISNVSVTEWGRDNGIKRNLNITLYADRNMPSTSKNRHHAKGCYIVLHGNPPYPAKGGIYNGPYSNQGHKGLNKKKGKNESKIN